MGDHSDVTAGEFVGRVRELRHLEDSYRASASAFIPIYGRRRVGKSELILHFLRGKPGIYFVGKKAPEQLQLREFLQEAATALDQPLLSAASAAGWKQAFELIGQAWRGPGKLVIALDEFQWMAEASPDLVSTLQELWDRRWREAGDVMVLLCGSLIGFMEREVLGKKSPLYGRRSSQMVIQPFGYREAADFHPSYSLVDRARAYFICGGVPLYLKFFAAGRSIETNIERAILDEFAPLHREPDFLLREELRGLENYYAILFALSSGSATAVDIVKATGIPDRNLHYYLQQLVGLGYLSRRYPLTGRRPVARHVRFVLDDPLLRFWFHFVYPNQSFILRDPTAAFAERIKPQLGSYFGGCFERLCREALPELYRREGIAAGFEIGEYWSREVQIDVVGYRDDGWTDIGECKWGKPTSLAAWERELSDKVPKYPNPRNATIGARLFTRDPVPADRSAAGGLRYHSLADLYDP